MIPAGLWTGLLLKGLVKKIVYKTDKRLVDVSISEKGKKLLQKTDVFESEIQQLMDNISEAEAKTLNKLLDKIRSK